MRARADLGNEPQRDARGRDCFTLRAQALDRFFYQLDLVDRIDIDRVNTGAHCIVDFVVRLARAVENDLIGTKADAQRLEKLAAAVDLNVDARVEHRLEDRHV